MRTREKFLKALAVTGNVTESCEIAGIKHNYVYEMRKRDPEFAILWDAAKETSTDVLETEARRRAMGFMVEETVEKVDPEGNVTHTTTKKPKYSEGLLKVLLKGHRPSVFDRSNFRVHDGRGDRGHMANMTDRELIAEIKVITKYIEDQRAIEKPLDEDGFIEGEIEEAKE